VEKLIISVATTGTWPTRAQTPYVPLTPAEIAEQAIDSWRAGAAIAHIHVRDDAGRHTNEPARYEAVRQRIRAAGCDLILNFTTSGGVGQRSEAERLAVAQLAPELASFDAGSTNFGDGVFINSPAFLMALARELAAFGVRPEIECFDASFLANALRLVDDGLLTPPLWVQFVLGVRGGAPATLPQLTFLVGQLPPTTPWSVCAIGRHQLPMNLAAMIMGGHVRTGLEDNLYYRRGELATSNAQLVERLVRLAGELGRPIASPAEARVRLGLRPC
jgi:3-keto-5-aminohexanoate cleavage enzyme